MEMNSSLTLRQMLDRLAEILVHKQTGTFFIATDLNSSCRFFIESGKLTHCTHRRDHGPSAIVSLLEASGGSCSFSENQRIPFRPEAVIDHQLGLQALGIQLVIPPKPAPLPEALPVPAKPAESPRQNRFYRGGGFEPQQTAPVELAVARQEVTQNAQPHVNNRFYRGGG